MCARGKIYRDDYKGAHGRNSYRITLLPCTAEPLGQCITESIHHLPHIRHIGVAKINVRTGEPSLVGSGPRLRTVCVLIYSPAREN